MISAELKTRVSGVPSLSPREGWRRLYCEPGETLEAVYIKKKGRVLEITAQYVSWYENPSLNKEVVRTVNDGRTFDRLLPMGSVIGFYVDQRPWYDRSLDPTQNKS